MNGESNRGPSVTNQEACAWIAKMHDAELTPEEVTELRQWMRQSPAHKSELRRIAKRWKELNVLTEFAVPVGSQPLDRDRTGLFSLDFFGAGRWAGSVATAAIFLLAVVLLQPLGSPQETLIYSTEIGEQRLVTLSDQSTVMLNTNSVIQVNYTSEVRGVQLLKGEAHFDVSSRRDRPFHVQVGKGVVRAIGTAFSVYLKQEVVEVLVTEGRVDLNTIQSYIESQVGSVAAVGVQPLVVISAGQAASFSQRFDAIELVENISAPEIERKLSWRDGLIKFSGDPLEDVITEISRYTSLKIVILDPKLRSLRVGGLFRVGETQKMLDALEIGFGVHAERINDKVIHLMVVKDEKK